MIPYMFTKRRNSKGYKYLLIFTFVLVFSARMKGQVVDSVWDRSGDTLILVHKPVVLKEKVLVYAPKPKSKKDPPPSDNHFFLNLLFNCYVDRQRYYNVAPS